MSAAFAERAAPVDPPRRAPHTSPAYCAPRRSFHSLLWCSSTVRASSDKPPLTAGTSRRDRASRLPSVAVAGRPASRPAASETVGLAPFRIEASLRSASHRTEARSHAPCGWPGARAERTRGRACRETESPEPRGDSAERSSADRSSGPLAREKKPREPGEGQARCPRRMKGEACEAD